MKASKSLIVSASVLTAALLTSVACNKQVSTNSDLKTDQEKASYAIGMQIGKSLKAQNADVSLPALTTGLSDALDGKESRLKPEEISAAMQKMREEAEKKAVEQAEKNKKDGEEFLAKNKAKAGVKTTASGLQYEVVQEGTGASPTAADVVKVHYTGMLINGEKFDSSVDRGEPVEFPVGGVIPGWTEALQLMKVGSKFKLTIPSDLAYGPSGRPGIPPNSVLVFDVELLEVKPAAAAPGQGAQDGQPAAKGKKK